VLTLVTAAQLMGWTEAAAVEVTTWLLLKCGWKMSGCTLAAITAMTSTTHLAHFG